MKSGIRRIGSALVAFAAALLASSAFALPAFYEGSLSSGISATGNTTGDGWVTNDGTGVDYWSFHAVAGDVVTIRVDRLQDGFDPTFSFYLGTATTQAGFNNGASWDGLTFIGFNDDENPPATGCDNSLASCPFGDPQGTYTIAEKALYTVIVGGFSSEDPNANYDYRITVTGNTPEPMTLALFGIGLAGLGFARRRIAGKVA